MQISDEQILYEYLLKDCSNLTQQIEELLKETTQEKSKKSKNLSNNFENEKIYEEKIESVYLKTEPAPKIGDDDYLDEIDDYNKQKENLLKEKKLLEDQFLDINIDIQKKAKQLSDFQEEIKKTKLEISSVENQLKEKTGFIQILEEQIESLKSNYKK